MNRGIHLLPALLLLALLLYSRVSAQLPDYHVRLFDESDGIRTDIQHVIKDNRGFIWLTYSDRVQRFDGNQMDEFILDDRINSVITDQDQNVWITSRAKVYLYDNSRKGFSNIEVDRTKKIEIGSVLQLPGKPVWLLTNLGFYTLDPKQSKFLPVENEKSITSTPINIRRNCASRFGNTIFYNSPDTIWSHDISTGIKRNMAAKNLLAIHAINETQVLVSTWLNQSFLYDLQSQTIQSIHPEKYLPRHQDDFLLIHAVVHLEGNRYLLATTKGILEYHSTSGKLIQKQFYFKGQPLSNVGRSVDLFLDTDRKIWACLENSIMVFDPFNEGIGLVRNSQMDQFNGVTSLIRNLAADEKENLWISTSNGITYWDLQKNEFTSIFAVEGATDRMNHPSVRGIAYDGNFVIIGQANRGIWLYQPKTKRFRSPVYEPGPTGIATKERVEGDFIDHINRLHNGDYFISARDGAYVLEKGSYLLRRIDFPGSQENLSFSYEDELKQVWIGTEKNIHCLDSNLVYRFSAGEDIGPGMKRCLLQWRANEYILGAKGLYSLSVSEGKVVTSILNHFFDQIHINTICRDRANRLWLATDRGLYRYTYESGMVETFDYFDNIQGDVYSGNSFYYNSEDLLFLGGANGINYFHPDKIQTRKDSLKVSLMKVSVNQDDTSFYNRAALLSLKPKQNSITFEYIAPYFGNTKRIQYRYKLEGLANTWNIVGNNTVVQFTSLNPGNYKFRIAASINGTEWFESDESIPFNIAFPFWQTWWFISFSTITIAAIVFFLMKQRIRFVRKQESERRQSEVQLITMNRDLAASQLTALRAQMNPHFIFNALNSVQRYILKGDVDQANRYLSKFSRLQREVLNNSNQDFISLEKEIEMLELYLQLEQLRFDEKFEYTITVDKHLDSSEIKIPPMILQPFIENAIWHGLMPRPGSKKVDIQFLLHSDELLYCSIRDNGIGRAASQRLKNNHEGSAVHHSLGLSLVNERLQILEQLYQRPYQVEVVDKTDPSGVVEGTEVNLTIHVGKLN